MYLFKLILLICIFSVPNSIYAQMDKALVQPITIQEIVDEEVRKEAQLISTLDVDNFKKYKLSKATANSFFFDYKNYTRFFNVTFGSVLNKEEKKGVKQFMLARVNEKVIHEVSFCHEKYMHTMDSILMYAVNKKIEQTFGLENQNIKIDVEAFLSKKTSNSYLRLHLYDDKNKDLKIILISLPVSSKLKFYACVI